MTIQGVLILSYRVSAMKLSDFGDVLKRCIFSPRIMGLLLTTGVNIFGHRLAMYDNTGCPDFIIQGVCNETL
jgi:hypothetical protein